MEYRNNFEITWLPLWKCNFKCPYCNGWKDTNALEFQPLNTLIEVWENLLNKIHYSHEEIIVNITGGEPTIYPNIFKFIKYLTNKVTRIHICSNLSFNADEFLNLKIPYDKISFIATFHPSCISVNNFINNLITLKQYIENNTVNFVADENNLKKQEFFIKKINDCGIKTNPLLLKFFGQDLSKGTFVKKNFDNFETLNSKSELNVIKKLRNTQKIETCDNESSKQVSFEKKCLAGYKYIQIFPNGNIKKCSKDTTYLGNIFNGDIHLYEEPHRCKEKFCSFHYNLILND